MKKDSQYFTISPPNLGWIEYKLDTQEMDYIWKCIDNKKHKISTGGTYDLMDRGKWFWSNTLGPMILEYEKVFGSKYSQQVPTTCRHPLTLERWWVNYQKQNQFNPDHDHSGLYSFVIWMKIPYNSKEQDAKYKFSDITTAISPDRNLAGAMGSFQFKYVDILGHHHLYTYALDASKEGTMLLFPAKMRHQVYPFYNCDEDRISVSGNIVLDSAKTI